MSTRLVGLALVFAAFSAFSLHAIAQVGYVGLFEAGIANPGAQQIFLDLVIGLSIAVGFMWPDARERGLPFAPYFAAILFLGSIGALAYLIHRELAAGTARVPATQAR